LPFHSNNFSDDQQILNFLEKHEKKLEILKEDYNKLVEGVNELITNLLKLPYKQILLNDYDDEVREQLIINNTVREFINAFEKVKNRGTKVTKEFIRRLDGGKGICLDVRLRPALDYAGQLDYIYFTDTLAELDTVLFPLTLWMENESWEKHQSDAGLSAKQNYFKLAFTLMFSRYWGLEYSGNKDIQRGVFDETCFPQLDNFLELLGHEPDLEYADLLRIAVNINLQYKPKRFRLSIISFAKFILYLNTKYNLFQQLLEQNPEKFDRFAADLFFVCHQSNELLEMNDAHYIFNHVSDEKFLEVYIKYFDRLSYEETLTFQTFTTKAWEILKTYAIEKLPDLFSKNEHIKFLVGTCDEQQLEDYYPPILTILTSGIREAMHICTIAASHHNWISFKYVENFFAKDTSAVQENSVFGDLKINEQNNWLCLAIADKQWEIAMLLIDDLLCFAPNPDLNYFKSEKYLQTGTYPIIQREFDLKKTVAYLLDPS